MEWHAESCLLMFLFSYWSARRAYTMHKGFVTQHDSPSLSWTRYCEGEGIASLGVVKPLLLTSHMEKIEQIGVRTLSLWCHGRRENVMSFPLRLFSPYYSLGLTSCKVGKNIIGLSDVVYNIKTLSGNFGGENPGARSIARIPKTLHY